MLLSEDSERSRSEIRTKRTKQILKEPEPLNSHIHTRDHRGAIIDYKERPEEKQVLDSEPTPNSQAREHFGYTQEEKLAIQKQDYVKKVQQFKPIARSLLMNANVIRRKDISHFRNEAQLDDELK